MPLLVEKCCEYLYAKGLDSEGLFRVSPAGSQLEKFKTEANRGSYDFSWITDPNVVAGGLKFFLRSLPDPIFTAERYRGWLNCIGKGDVRSSLRCSCVCLMHCALCIVRMYVCVCFSRVSYALCIVHCAYVCVCVCVCFSRAMRSARAVSCIGCARLRPAQETLELEALKKLIENLPPQNLVIVKTIMLLLKAVLEHEEKNKMTPKVHASLCARSPFVSV